MPRTGKGGKREGSAQTAYSNRIDLNNRGPQPITVAPGEAYGERKMLEDAQRTVPMRGTPMDAHPVAQMQAASAAVPQIQGINPMMPETPMPGTVPFLHPTDRPDEHIMTGTDGVKPAGLGNQQKLSDILEAASHSPWATSLVMQLLEHARAANL